MNRISKLWWTFRIKSWFYRKQQSFCLSNPKPKCYIFLAADYGNLGDVAITYAQKKFLKDNFPEYEIIEIPCVDTISQLLPIKKSIGPDDIITVVGGGNMGDMYYDIELLRLLVVKTFHRNKIILFPQTIDYSDSREAKHLLRLSQKIYRLPSNLLMSARERESYKSMKRLYPDVRIVLTPDIVMSLDERNEFKRENTTIFCLRNDKEKASNDQLVEILKEITENQGYNHKFLDTHIGGDRYSEDEKYKRLHELWNEFSKSKLVVTDRLHGMIFAFITRTPALVLANSNFKVRACYEWIKSSGYIKFLDKKETENKEYLLHAIQNWISKFSNTNTAKEVNINFAIVHNSINRSLSSLGSIQ